MMEQRNLILAIVLSVSILLGYQVLIEGPRMEQERALREAQKAQETTRTTQAPQPGVAVPPGAPAAVGNSPMAGAAPIAGQPPAAASRSDVLKASPRVEISTDRAIGSIRLRGGLIDDLVLRGYRESIKEDSKNIVMLSPPNADKAYYARFGWVSQTAGIDVPDQETVWTADRKTLTVGQPLTLSWTNPQGVEFLQTISIDKNFMFEVRQSIRNGGGKSITIHPFGLVSLSGTPETSGFWILHEGLTGVFNGTLKEMDYDDIQDETGGVYRESGPGGWLGITAKYFATALIPDQKIINTSRFVHTSPGGKDKYQADYLAAAVSIAPGQSSDYSTRLFAGAKEVRLLDSYEEKYSVPRFDRLVDFGWFYFLTKPIFYVLDYFFHLIGNFGVAILLLTVLIKLAFFPLANKSYRSMSRLKKLQPKMVEIRERYKDDRQRQNQAMMELYKKEGANPMSGCFPILIQIPVFFALYKVLFVTIEMRHAPFFGWIQDLSAPDPLGLLTAFGILEWNVPQALAIVNIGIWPIIMGITMYLQQKLNPQPADPMQQKIFMFLPIVFTFMLGSFPAGLVIYWAWNNTLSIAQQWVIMRRMGVSASGESISPEAPKAPPRGSRSKREPDNGDGDSRAKPVQPTKNKSKSRRQRNRR